ncbi:MAG: MiaB/RimO family radical SAM methylthiotransferase [Clostridium sp.]|nr:MiaB/RimO family radical SAM methylthiotransferase [Clostridium sp.]
MKEPVFVSPAEIAASKAAAKRVKDEVYDLGLTYHIESYGCQMNEHDSEKIAGMMEEMGYAKAEDKSKADFIIFNTCCIREHAEQRVYGNIGALKKRKDENPKLMIGVCGCMMQQKDAGRKLFKRFPFVDIVFGTNELHRFPLLFEEAYHGERTLQVRDMDGEIAEGLPVCRNSTFSTFTLLGQNVNSYKGDGETTDFPALLRMVHDQVPELKRIRFMTSHPKDLSSGLIDAMAELPRVCKHIHLPVQSGSSRILKLMNRCYTREKYIEEVQQLRAKVPEIELTTDIIVGFPGETEADFKETLSLVEQVGYSAAYTFMYSPRKGTAAATMPDQIPDEVKHDRLERLNEVQSKVLRNGNMKYIGTYGEVLVEGCDHRSEPMAYGKLSNFKMVYFPGDDSLVGSMRNVKITGSQNNSLIGELV